MTTYYTLNILKSNTTLRLTYRAKFVRLELKKGKLTAQQLSEIGRIIPPTEQEIPSYQQQWQGKVTYTQEVKQKSLYSQFCDSWFAFYEEYMGFRPKFTGVDGKHLKQIIKYLQEVCNDDAEALNTWKGLLGNWHNLDEFHQKNTDLKYINSQMNKILQNAKKGNAKGGNSYSQMRKTQQMHQKKNII